MATITDISILHEANVFEHADIQGYLDQNPGDRYIVTEDGIIYYADGTGEDRLSVFQTYLYQRHLPPKAPKGREGGLPKKVLKDVFDTFWMDRQNKGVSAAEFKESVIADLINLAIERDASDIHYEARKADTSGSHSRCRFRVHGRLVKISEGVSFELARRTITQFFQSENFAGSNFTMSEPCDAVFDYIRKGCKYNVRLSSIPMVNGIKMVCRIRSETDIMDIRKAGYSPGQLAVVSDTMRLNEGLFLLCGPTNAGKSTTVTSLIAQEPIDRCVVELGDPIETVLPNCAHVDMAPKGEGETAIGRSNALIDSTLRQDTDILVLGEIRNEKTASAAEKLAEQGKLVISTLHTASVVSVFARLTGIGMSASLLSMPGFFRAAVAQKLVPVLCPQCSLPEPPLSGNMAHKKMDDVRIRVLVRLWMMANAQGTPEQETTADIRYRNVQGCDSCQGAGIIGRTLVAEAMRVDDGVRSIYGSGDLSGLHEYLIREQGMETIHEHALSKIAIGQIDPLDTENRIEKILPTSMRFMPPDEARKMMEDLRMQSRKLRS